MKRHLLLSQSIYLLTNKCSYLPRGKTHSLKLFNQFTDLSQSFGGGWGLNVLLQIDPRKDKASGFLPCLFFSRAVIWNQKNFPIKCKETYW